MPENHFVTVNGIKTRYWDEGDHKETIVLIHGLASCIEYFENNIETLLKKYRVIALDLVGSGETDKPACLYSHETFTLFLKGFFDALSIDQCTLVGHSLGGGIALAFAAEYPQHVKRLVLVSSAGFCHELPLHYRMVTFPFVGKMVLQSCPVEITKKILQKMVYQKDKITDEFSAVVNHYLRPKETRRALLNIMKQFINIHGVKPNILKMVQEEVKKLTMPVYMLWGKEDPLLTVRSVDTAKKLIPNLHVKIFKECGHIPMIENPKEFNDFILGLD